MQPSAINVSRTLPCNLGWEMLLPHPVRQRDPFYYRSKLSK